MAEPAPQLVEETDDDREFMARLYASTRTEELAPVPWSDDEKATFLRGQFEAQDRHYREHYADTDRRVIRLDGTAVGRLYLQRREGEFRIVNIADGALVGPCSNRSSTRPLRRPSRSAYTSRKTTLPMGFISAWAFGSWKTRVSTIFWNGGRPIDRSVAGLR